MTSFIQSGANGQHEDELAELRRRIVADGYSSAHSCQHCDEIFITSYDWSQIGGYQRYADEISVLATEEEMRQHAAAGCKFWSMVWDELNYKMLEKKRVDSAGMSVPQCSSSPVSEAE